MDVYRHPSNDKVLRLAFEDGEDGIVEADFAYDPPAVTEVSDVPPEWRKLE